MEGADGGWDEGGCVGDLGVVVVGMGWEEDG